MFRDRLLVVSLVVAICGFGLFQLSSISAMYVLQRIDTGQGTFLVAHGENSTLYFSAIHGQTPHLVFHFHSGSSVDYTIFKYNYVQGPYGNQYYQYRVANGTATTTNGNVYLPLVYVDTTYLVNMTATGQAAQNVTVTAYSEFYLYQPFQYPAEIAGLLVMLAGIIMTAVRLTVIFSPR